MSYFVYIMASVSGTIYLGVTNNIERRVWEHKSGMIEGFSKKYGCNKLVYVEEFADVREAIVREKQLKRGRREKKEWLIGQQNPGWRDLSAD
jgi:putative endonuclease